MKKNVQIDAEESKKGCYIMVGPAIKYEPAWANPVDRKEIEEVNAGTSLASTTLALKKAR